MPGVEYSTITNTYHIKCGCDDQCLKTLPNVTFVLGGKSLSLEPEAYIIRVSNISSTTEPELEITCPDYWSSSSMPLF